MYAVIASGGKQYRVQKGGSVRVEKLVGDVGSAVKFDQVLLVGSGDSVKVGTPMLSGAAVQGTISRHFKGEKRVIVKFRRRKHYLRQGTHRQNYTEVQITDISG